MSDEVKIFAISDLHLSILANKPMDIFGDNWNNYFERITEDWTKKVGENDIVLISGDISWGLRLEDAVPDLAAIGQLPGRKIIIRGNHDYWWSSYTKVKAMLPPSIFAVQNNALKLGGVIFCGTRGWVTEVNSAPEDVKIYNREVIRLKMSLDEAMKLRTNGEDIIVMTHFPPFNAKFMDSEMTELISAYPVKCVVYGHLHGTAVRASMLVTKNQIPYFLTSCDLLNHKLIELK